MIKSRRGKDHLWKSIAILMMLLFALYVAYAFLSKKEGFIVLTGRSSASNPLPRSSNIVVNYYFLPGCPYCRDFDPTWNKFSTEMAGRATFNKIDGSNTTVPEYVKGYPHIEFMVNGEPKEYNGDRSINDLKNNLNRYT
jgi:thiol-disulfide isomerase/thioredoxin